MSNKTPKISRLDAMRAIQFARQEPAVSMMRGKWHVVSPKTGLLLATEFDTPEEAYMSAARRGFISSNEGNHP